MNELVELDKEFNRGSITTGWFDSVLYLFWKKGVSYKEFMELPNPYIFKIINLYTKEKKEEIRAYKKQPKGRK